MTGEDDANQHERHVLPTVSEVSEPFPQRCNPQHGGSDREGHDGEQDGQHGL